MLLFPAGKRASTDAVERLLAQPSAGKPQAGKPPAGNPPGGEAPVGASARISSQRGRTDGWLELLSSGLTFDLVGLAPGSARETPRARHWFGLSRDVNRFAFEAIVLLPGPHLAGAGAMVPVVRTMALLASELAQGLGALAVCWQPAGSWMDVAYFARITQAWGAGGAFPALGLTGITRTHDGGAETDGLAYFTGQELRVESRSGEAPAETVKLAVRMVDHMIREGRVSARAVLSGPDGEPLLAEPSGDGRRVRLWRDA